MTYAEMAQKQSLPYDLKIIHAERRAKEFYEKILGDSITDDMKQLKAEGNLEEYKKKIVSLIQGGKVENAYKLIKVWNQRNFSIDEIPDVIKKLIGKV